MADSIISLLPNGGAIQLNDDFVVARGSQNYRIAGEQLFPQPEYDVAVFAAGTMASGETLMKWVSPHYLTFAENFAGSFATASIVATSQSTITIKKNGSTVGFVRFYAGYATASFASSGIITVAIGDVLEFLAQASPDATLADVSITLSGRKQVFLDYVAPINTVAPIISGTLEVGEVVACSPGNWTGNPTPSLSFQWLRDGAQIVGQQSQSYTLASPDIGTTISCIVTAVNGGGSASVTVNATGLVVA